MMNRCGQGDRGSQRGLTRRTDNSQEVVILVDDSSSDQDHSDDEVQCLGRSQKSGGSEVIDLSFSPEKRTVKRKRSRPRWNPPGSAGMQQSHHNNCREPAAPSNLISRDRRNEQQLNSHIPLGRQCNAVQPAERPAAHQLPLQQTHSDRDGITKRKHHDSSTTRPLKRKKSGSDTERPRQDQQQTHQPPSFHAQQPSKATTAASGQVSPHKQPPLPPQPNTATIQTIRPIPLQQKHSSRPRREDATTASEQEQSAKKTNPSSSEVVHGGQQRQQDVVRAGQQGQEDNQRKNPPLRSPCKKTSKEKPQPTQPPRRRISLQDANNKRKGRAPPADQAKTPFQHLLQHLQARRRKRSVVEIRAATSAVIEAATRDHNESDERELPAVQWPESRTKPDGSNLSKERTCHSSAVNATSHESIPPNRRATTPPPMPPSTSSQRASESVASLREGGIQHNGSTLPDAQPDSEIIELIKSSSEDEGLDERPNNPGQVALSQGRNRVGSRSFAGSHESNPIDLCGFEILSDDDDSSVEWVPPPKPQSEREGQKALSEPGRPPAANSTLPGNLDDLPPTVAGAMNESSSKETVKEPERMGPADIDEQVLQTKESSLQLETEETKEVAVVSPIFGEANEECGVESPLHATSSSESSDMVKNIEGSNAESPAPSVADDPNERNVNRHIENMPDPSLRMDSIDSEVDAERSLKMSDVGDDSVFRTAEEPESLESISSPIVPFYEPFYRPGASEFDCIDMKTDESVSIPPEEDGISDKATCGIARSTCYQNENFPVLHLSVFSMDDTILYTLKIEVGQSEIVNGGHGAFLTYLGAHVLRPEVRQRHHELTEGMVRDKLAFMDPLTASLPGDFNVRMKLVGRKLQTNHGCEYKPFSSKFLQAGLTNAALSSSGIFRHKTETIALKGKGIDRFEELRRRPRDGVGHLRLHSFAEYRPVDNIPFDTDLVVDLGAYAPLSGTDRKTDPVKEAKVFLFANNPAEWCFEVEENFCGCKQQLDITDDCTGEPHANARQHIPMYINEVGHSARTHNVFIRDQDGRSVKYYFATKELQQGKTVELLTNYGPGYELVRERKGYGIKNVVRGDKSDDDFSTMLSRETDDRNQVEESLHDMSYVNIHRILDFIATKTLPGFLQSFDGDTPCPSDIQCRALVRMAWFGHVALRRVHVLRENVDPNNRHQLEFLELSLRHATQLTTCTASCLESWIPTERNATVLVSEVVKEIVYGVRHKIRLAFSPSVWCPLSAKLLNHLFTAVAVFRLHRPSKSARQALLVEILHHGRSAFQELNICAVDSLSFTAGTHCQNFPLDKLRSDESSIDDSASCCTFQTNITVPKAVLWATSIAHTDKSLSSLKLQGNYLVVRSNGGCSLSSNICELSRARPDKVNKSWYAVWQIGYVLRVLVDEFLPTDLGGQEHLDRLFEEVDSELPRLTQDAVGLGMRSEHGERVDRACELASKVAHEELNRSSDDFFRKLARGQVMPQLSDTEMAPEQASSGQVATTSAETLTSDMMKKSLSEMFSGLAKPFVLTSRNRNIPQPEG